MLPYLVGLFLWGFAEGTVFFLISEVGLAAAVMRFPARWWQLAAETLVGLLAGGALTHQLAFMHTEKMTALLTRLPGHPPALLEKIRQDLLARGWGALTLALLAPRPFKFYALAAGASDMNVFALLATGVVARGARLFALGFVVSRAALYSRLWARPWIGLQTLGVGIVLSVLYIVWVERTYRRRGEVLEVAAPEPGVSALGSEETAPTPGAEPTGPNSSPSRTSPPSSGAPPDSSGS